MESLQLFLAVSVSNKARNGLSAFAILTSEEWIDGLSRGQDCTARSTGAEQSYIAEGYISATPVAIVKTVSMDINLDEVEVGNDSCAKLLKDALQT